MEYGSRALCSVGGLCWMELWAMLMVLVLSFLAPEAQAQGLASVLEGEMREGLLATSTTTLDWK